MKLAGKIFAVDFDGTCVTHDFPKVGRNIGAQSVLKRIIAEGGQIIIWTMRSQESLSDAIAWFKANDIPFIGANKNPAQHTWSSSPKAYAQVYIDDAALGCPLIHAHDHERPYVDWRAVEKLIFGN